MLGILLASACAAQTGEDESELSETSEAIVNGKAAPGVAAKLGIVKLKNTYQNNECTGVLLDNMNVATFDDCAVLHPGVKVVLDGKEYDTVPGLGTRLFTGEFDTLGRHLRLNTLRLKYALAVNGATSGFQRDTYAGSAQALVGSTLRCFGYGNKTLGGAPTNELVQADLPVAEAGKGYVRVGRGPGLEALSRGDMGGPCFLGDKLVGVVSKDFIECPGSTCSHATVTLAGVTTGRRGLFDHASPQLLKNRATGACMTVDATGNPYAAACDGFNDAQWLYSNRFWSGDHYSDSYEEIGSHRTGQMITVGADVAGPYTFAPLVQKPFANTTLQSWDVLETAQPGYYELRPFDDHAQCWQQTGSAYQLAPCNGAATQQFQFLLYPELNDVRLHEGGGLCVDVPGAKQSDGAPVAHETCSGASNQLWQITREFSSNTWDATLNLHPRHAPSKCLSVVGNSKVVGAKLEQRTCDGSASQEFLMIRRGETIRIKNRNSGLCVWRPWHFLGSHWSGDTLELGDCNDGGSAAWMYL